MEIETMGNWVLNMLSLFCLKKMWGQSSFFGVISFTWKNVASATFLWWNRVTKCFLCYLKFICLLFVSLSKKKHKIWKVFCLHFFSLKSVLCHVPSLLLYGLYHCEMLILLKVNFRYHHMAEVSCLWSIMVDFFPLVFQFSVLISSSRLQALSSQYYAYF